MQFPKDKFDTVNLLMSNQQFKYRLEKEMQQILKQNVCVWKMNQLIRQNSCQLSFLPGF